MTDPTGRVFDALADANRRYVVEALAERGTATATELAAELNVSRQAVAKHFAALSDAGLVESRRDIPVAIDVSPVAAGLNTNARSLL